MVAFEKLRAGHTLDPLKGTLAWQALRLARDTGVRAVHGTKYRHAIVHSTATAAGNSSGLDKHSRAYWKPVEATLDREVYRRNFFLVSSLLDEAGIEWWWVDAVGHRGRRVVGVRANDKPSVKKMLVQTAMSRSDGAALRIKDATTHSPHYSLAGEADWELLEESGVWRVAEVVTFNGFRRDLGLPYGCDIEFWHFDEHDGTIAPRENRAAKELDAENCRLVGSERDGVKVKVPAAFEQKMLDDIDFPIDVVYTWVDGNDPEWQARKATATGDDPPVPLHAEATDPARFRSRDELLYSLRSLDDFAPWVRKVFIVTDRQVPAWLNTANDRVQIVDHSEIFPDDGRLPVFNSNAIICRLHHIEGLAEHFIYMNDDVMLSRPVKPQQFFMSSGIALVSPSNNRRPFIEPSVEHLPHQNLTSNIRRLMIDSTGRNVSRAIKHTPHAMLRSVLSELEQKFPEAYDRTTRSKFRHHEDIVADQLHHYYALATGRAAFSHITYMYLNILDNRYAPNFRALSRKHNRDAICINDAPVEDAVPNDEKFVRDFLENYFPATSQYETQSHISPEQPSVEMAPPVD